MIVTCDRSHKISFAFYHVGSSTAMAAGARSYNDFVNLFITKCFLTTVS